MVQTGETLSLIVLLVIVLHVTAHNRFTAH